MLYKVKIKLILQRIKPTNDNTFHSKHNIHMSIIHIIAIKQAQKILKLISKPPSLYTAPITLSKVLARMETALRPPDFSSCGLRISCSPQPSFSHSVARCARLTMAERILVNWPSSAFGKRLMSSRLTTSSSTASPRYSRRS